MMNQTSRRLILVFALAIMVVTAGCGIGHSRMAFVTNTSHGVDLETVPSRTSLAFSRQVGVIAPQYPGGEVPPVLATVTRADTSDMGGFQKAVNAVGKFFGFGTHQSFATGKAAFLYAANVGHANSQEEFQEGVSLVEGTVNDFQYDQNPGLLVSIVRDGLIKGLFCGSQLDHKAKNPYFFGTNTSFGLDVAYTPKGVPKSLAMGLKRQELAVVVVSPSTIDRVTSNGTIIPHLVPNVPSLFASFSLGTSATGGGSALDIDEVFATGQVAEAMAKNSVIREQLMSPALLRGLEASSLTPAQQDFKTQVRQFYDGGNDAKKEEINKVLTGFSWNSGTGYKGFIFSGPGELTPERVTAIRARLRID